MKKIIFLFAAFLVVLMVFYTFYSYVYLSPGTTVSPDQKNEYGKHSISISVHAIFGAISLFTGMLQLIKKIREKFPSYNIFFRKVYYFSVLISATVGLYVATYAQGGLVNKIGFFILALLWIWSIIMAINADIKSDIDSFRIWIVRNYAMTFASITLRLWLPFLWGIYDFQFSHYSEVYQTLGFLCWIPNLIITEWIYLSKK